MSDPVLPGDSDPPTDAELHTDLGNHYWRSPDPRRWSDEVWKRYIDAHLQECHLHPRRGTPIADTYPNSDDPDRA